jgi:hypothetical protein
MRAAAVLETGGSMSRDVVDVATIDDVLEALHLADLDELVYLVHLGRRSQRFGAKVLDFLDLEVNAYGEVVDVKLREAT